MRADWPSARWNKRLLAGEVGAQRRTHAVGKIVHARKLSRATMANIWRNLFFSILFNAAGGGRSRPGFYTFGSVSC